MSVGIMFIGRDISPNYEYRASDSKFIKKALSFNGAEGGIRFFEDGCKNLCDYAYWMLLGEMWDERRTGCVALYRWRSLFLSTRKSREVSLMKPSEIRALSKLPDECYVYRARRKDEVDCLSFTLDMQKAGKMAQVRGNNCVHEFLVRKSDIYALILRSKGGEVIILDSSVLTFVGLVSVEVK